MTQGIWTIHVDDVPIEKMQKRDGWAISEFRLPISRTCGSSTTVFHSIFRPGSTHAKHLHEHCEEIAFYQKGHGVVGQSDSRAEVTPGYCRLMPRGTEHFFFNETEKEDALAIGFYIGAGDVAATGYRFCGDVTKADLAAERGGLSEGILIHLSEVDLQNTEEYRAWSGSEVRMPIGRHNGSANAMIHIRIPTSGVVPPYRLKNCEQSYSVIRGRGIAFSSELRETELREGHFIFVPKGIPLSLRNQDSLEPMEVIGVLTGAGSLQEAGYVDVG